MGKEALMRFVECQLSVQRGLKRGYRTRECSVHYFKSIRSVNMIV